MSKPLEPPQAPVAAPAVADPVATDPVGTDPGKILGELVDIFARILQEPREAIDTGAPLVELGADSIVLMEALRAIETNYEVRIPIQQLFEELSTLSAISRFLATESPVARPAEPAAAAAPNRVAPPAAAAPAPQAAAAPAAPNRVAPPAAPNRVAPLEAPPSAAPNRVAPQAPAAAAPASAPDAAQTGSYQDLMRQQLEIVSRTLNQVVEQQLASLSGVMPAAPSTPVAPEPAAPIPAAPEPVEAVPAAPIPATPMPAAPVPAAPLPSVAETASPAAQTVSLPFPPVSKPSKSSGLNAQQEEHVRDLVARFEQRTRGSKERTQKHRSHLADNRASVGFKFSIKEMLYPIIAERSQGARIWDVDGNEYLDISGGFGVHLFGHQPDFVMQAVQRQLADGFHLGPQSNLAGEVAQWIAEMTGLERVAFSNTGTEAVMTALRLARAETGRRKVALFAGSYHGHYDGVLGMRSGFDSDSAVPMAIGVSPSVTEDLLVLEYGAEASLELIRRHGHELAAVLCEPVQSRRPDLQPRAFLRQLRELTQEIDAALIFDEMITGFRVAPGGAQEWYGIRADLATYGKVVGGGMPIGVVTGSARFMDRIDGGHWQYGDNTYPAREMTFFAGTFCKHPLALAASRAVLEHLRQEGPGLQARLNQRTQEFAERLNRAFQEEGVPIKVVFFGSLFRFVFEKPLDLFFYHLALRGIFVWEGRNFFLSTAHSDADVERLIAAVQESVEALRQGGFLPPSAHAEARRWAKAVPPLTVKDPIGGRAEVLPDLAAVAAPGARPAGSPAEVDFSVIFFSDAGRYSGGNPYRLVFDIADYVDRHEFSALWMPERHFHRFGGIYANPAVLAAALATRTQNIRLRAGSIVLPLHHPTLVAESWAMIDNLSGGRADLAFASGWNPNDFVISPETFEHNKQVWKDRIPVVQELWRQNKVAFRNGVGEEVEVKTFPPPVQSEPAVWLTASRLAETFEYAGEMGYNVLTMLMGSTVEELGEKIELYRRARERNGFDPEAGTISLMLHTFVHPDGEFVRQQVRDPFHQYIQTAITSHSQAAGDELKNATPEEIERLAELSFERYSRTAALIGTPEECVNSVRRFKAVGVNEVACLCDFGADPAAILQSLPYLDEVRRSFAGQPIEPDPGGRIENLAPAGVTAATATEGSARQVPLTVVQRQHLFLARLDPAGSIAHNDLAAFELAGPLDVDLLDSCLQALCRRHEALRIGFDDEAFHQVIHPQASVGVTCIDLTGVAETAAEQAWQARLAGEAAHRFDLAAAPLLRCHVLRLGAEHTRLLLTSNQIVLDGWSLGVLFKELAELYNAAHPAAGGSTMPPHAQQLPEVPSYADYVQRQLAYRDSETAEGNREYWRTTLAGELPVLDLPLARPRPAMQTYPAESMTFRLSPERLQALRRLGSQVSATPFMILLAAHAVTLRRFARQDDLIIGTPVALRDGASDASLVGYATNLLPIRCRLEGRMSGSACIRGVRDQLFGAFAHQSFPLGDILEELQLDRDVSRPPLIGTTFNFDRPLDDPGFHQVRATLSPVPFAYVPFDLTLNVIEEGGGLLFYCVYHRDLFEASLIESFLDHYDRLLDALAASPETPIAHLIELGPAAYQQMVVDWNQTAVDRAGIDGRSDRRPERNALEVIERRLREQPEAILAEQLDRQAFGRDASAAEPTRHLSAAALDHRSQRVARALLAAGAGPEAQVVLLAHRDLDFWVVMLGILRAGAAYLPLDPGLPAQRLAQVLDECDAEIIVARSEHLQLLDTVEGLMQRRMRLTRLVASEIVQQDSAAGIELPSPRQLDPKRLAYLLFTSGSTGRPKCAMVEHGGMINHIWAKLEDLDVREGDAVAQNGPASFDVSLWQWLGPLMVGARAVVIPDELARDPAVLVDLVADAGVSQLEMVPSLLTLMVDELERRDDARRDDARRDDARRDDARRDDERPSLGALRWIVPTGETLPPLLCRRWLALFPSVPLLNTYGHTECSDDEMHWPIASPPAEDEVRVPVGRPIGNLRAYVLDQDLQPLPVGVTGDVYMGGVGVGRGYLGRPVRTAESFRPDPLGPGAGARLYRTGDLGRWRSSGCLDYLGRGDSQVKLGGNRIELGEIEAVLTRHDGVAEAVVMVRSDQPGIDRLVAYVVASSEATESDDAERDRTEELSRFLRDRLPDSMVPVAFVSLPAMPLNANGKTDRRALPAPDLSVLAGEDREPATATEQRLAALWGEMLGVEAVGMNDSFFALGGHSLVATQLFARLRQDFDAAFPLRWIFEAPTVRELSKRIDERLAHGVDTTETARAVAPSSGATRPSRLPLSFPQQGVWFLEQIEGPSATYHLIDVIRLEGELDSTALQRALERLVERHEALRMGFRDEDGAAYVEIEEQVPFEQAWSEQDLSELPTAEREAELETRLKAVARQPFDLEHAPLLRVRLLKEAEGRHVLALVVHHLVADGWSLGVMVRDLGHFYGEQITGSAPDGLPALDASYVDYALEQRGGALEPRDAGAAVELEPKLDFWRETFATPVPELTLPRPDAVASELPEVGAAGALPLTLDPDLVPELERLAGQHNATLFMVILTAFHAALARVTGHSDVVIGTPVAHRDRREWEDLVGFFASSLPLRLRVAGDARFTAALEQVRAAVVSAFAHDVAFEQIVGAAGVERSVDQHPLYQACLVLQNMPIPEILLPGLEATPVADVFPVSPFDLVLSFDLTVQPATARLLYRKDRCTRTAARALAALVEDILHGLRRDPDPTLAKLGAPPTATPVAAGSYPSVVEGVVTRARVHPDRIALIDGDRAVTYEWLERTSAALAVRLREQGAGREQRVAVCMDRSCDLIIALLAVMRSGAAYVPLDPDYPRERLATIIADSGARLVLTEAAQRSQVAALDSDVEVQVFGELVFDRLTHEDPPGSARPDTLLPSLEPEQAAYVIYTSGTTGTPKGVVVSQDSVARLLVATRERFDFDATDTTDTWTLFHSYAFDFSVWEIWGALYHGARLVVVPHLVSRSPEEMGELLASHRVTVLNQTPTAFLPLVDHVRPETAPELRLVIFGGEALHPNQLGRWFERFGDARPELVNMYGITETTVHVTHQRVSSDSVDSSDSPIGQPIDDLHVALLGPRLEPVAPGRVGEMFVGGAGVARGYLDRPRLTAERFVPDPTAGAFGERLYRSGDLAVRVGTGLEYLGRNDAQIKLRGFRIEPGEIEACLMRHPAVDRAVVGLRSLDGSGGTAVAARATVARPEPQQLVAWVLLAPKDPLPGEAELREHAARSLPSHMVPHRIAVVAELPLTATGKLDQRRLAALPLNSEQTGSESGGTVMRGTVHSESGGTALGSESGGTLMPGTAQTGSESGGTLLSTRSESGGTLLSAPLAKAPADPPTTDAERILHRVWCEVLRREDVGIHDNFFEIGGDSILSIQIVARCRKAGVQITARQVFEHKTIAKLAANVGSVGIVAVDAVAVDAGAVAKQATPAPRSHDGAIPLTPIQQRFFATGGAAWHHDNQHVLLWVDASVTSASLESCLAALTAHHAAFGLRFRPTFDGVAMRYEAAGTRVAFQSLDLSTADAATRRAALLRANREVQSGFDLDRGPLFAAVHLRMPPGEATQLLLVTHHLVIDGVSWRVILDDLQTLLTQAMAEARLELGVASTSFVDWAWHLDAWAGRLSWRDELAPWLEDTDLPAVSAVQLRELMGLPEAVPDRVDSERFLRFELDEETTAALTEAVGRQVQAPLDGALLAALVEALDECFGPQAWWIDVEGHGRGLEWPDVDLSRTVGWFTSIVPLRLAAAGEASASTLERVEAALRGVPSGGVAWGLARSGLARPGLARSGAAQSGSVPAEIAERLEAIPECGVLFNYLGSFQGGEAGEAGALLGFAPGAGSDLGGNRAGERLRTHPLAIETAVVAGRLEVEVRGPGAWIESAGGQALAAAMESRLRAMLGAAGRFPAARVGAAELDALLVDLKRRAVGPVADVYELTPMQGGMLFHRLYDERGSVYFEQFSFVIEEAIDVATLRRAWQQTVERHDVLRTCFFWEGLSRPLQVVLSEVELPWREEDWSQLSPSEQRLELERLREDDIEQGFDLTQAPLCRWVVVHLADHKTFFLWSHHHLLLDGWSLHQVFDEAFARYRALASGTVDASPASAPRFRDFVTWLQRQERSAEETEAYWRDLLSGFGTPTPLPLSRTQASEPASRNYRFRELEMELSADDSRTILEFARREQLTASTVIQGLWALFLGRSTGERDVVFGATVSGRSEDIPDVEEMVGLLINGMPIRVRLDEQSTPGEWLRELQQQIVLAQAFAYTPLVDLQSWSDLEPGTNLFDTLVVFENYPLDPDRETQVAQLRIQDLSIVEQTNFPLLFVIFPGDPITLRLTFDPQVFDPTEIEVGLRRLVTLLRSLVNPQTRTLGDVEMLDERERRQVLEVWNDTEIDHGRPAALHQLIEQVAARQPDAVALHEGTRALTYGGLDRQTHRLARVLRSRGLGREGRVGISIDRSIEMVVAIVATLKGGGVFVPLDPDYPEERLAFMIEDAALDLLVTTAGIAARLPSGGCEVLVLEEIAGEVATSSDQPLALPVAPDQAAYVLYTSGSTGLPKGAANTHAGGANRVLWNQSQTPLDGTDRLLQKTPLNFDVSVNEIFWPLSSGAQLVLARPGGHRDSGYLVETVAREAITVMVFVPSLLSVFLDEPELAQCRSLRRVICSGEALLLDHQQRVFERIGSELYNFYGPTEAAVDVTWWQCQPGDRLGSIPIGRPIANTQIYILDEALRPLPAGLVGTLYIGGRGLARGYHRRLGMTAERFIPDPVGGRPGGRLYNTGDLARFRSDGNVEFLGRRDFQVKLRGVRIELGEIEVQLASSEAVREVVVMMREDRPGDQRLTAYIRPHWALLEAQVQGGVEEDADAHVSQWQEVYDDLYGHSPESEPEAEAADPTFNIVGWNDSFTGAPMSPEVMREWRDQTVRRILAVRPRRVLEIGCGSGLLLHQIAPECELYAATDLSQAALDLIAASTSQTNLRLQQASALDVSSFAGEPFAEEPFDVAVLNSVAQYFPSAEYLTEVLRRVVEHIRPGGALFLGDLRSLPLLPALQTSIELYHASDTMDRIELQRRVRRRQREERELLLDPRFFRALQEQLPRVTHVAVQQREGTADNELTRYRYDVVLYLDSAEPEHPPLQDHGSGHSGITSLAAMRNILSASSDGDARGHRFVLPDPRVAREVAMVAMVAEAQQAERVGDWRRAAAELPTPGIHPQQIWDLARELGWRALVRSTQTHGQLEAVLVRVAEHVPIDNLGTVDPTDEPLASQPLYARVIPTLEGQLRQQLQQRLPEQMQLSAMMFVDDLPRAPNGKIDRSRLPAPEVEARGEYRAPESPVEAQLVEIWQEVLGVERIGTADSFFDLGGHSLLATQLVARIRQNLGAEASVRLLFEHRTIRELAEALATASQAQPGLDLLRVERDEPLPLSASQERLWLLDWASGAASGGAYNMPIAFTVRGGLSVDALRDSFAALMARHEILRSRFVATVEGDVQMLIDAEGQLDFERVDDAADVDTLLAGEAARPFDLERGPLARVRVVPRSNDEHTVLLVLHHIISDGWSVSLLADEWARGYAERVAGRSLEATAPELQFADFAVAQKRWLESGVGARQLEFWQRHLASAPAEVELPFDKLPAAEDSLAAGVYRFRLTAAQRERVETLARQAGATSHMVLLAGFAALLHRLRGQETLVVGTPTANRQHSATESMLGFFVNTLPLCLSIDPEASFSELVASVRAVALAAQSNQDVPFHEITQAVNPPRLVGRNPLFQVSFVWQNVPRPKLTLADLEVQAVVVHSGVAKLDLTLEMEEVDDGIAASFEYRADLFRAATVERLAEQLTQLLDHALDAPQHRVRDLRLMSRRERERVLRLATRRDVEPPDLRLHELFEQRVERTPDAIAIADRGAADRATLVSYRALDATASRWAAILRQSGLTPDQRVGVALPRGADLLTAYLAILKAGGAFVPLDPEYPIARLRSMVKRCGAARVVTNQAIAEAVGLDGAQTVRVEALRLAAGAEPRSLESGLPPVELSSVELSPASAAYGIFTSGSTGEPNCVVVSHAAIVNTLAWRQRDLPLEPADRVLQTTSPSFDASLWEFFAPLVAGACVDLSLPSGVDGRQHIAGMLVERRISQFQLPPAWLTVLVEDPALRDARGGVRRIITGAEPLSRDLQQRLFDALGAELHDLYGPTEAAIDVTAFRCSPEDSAPFASIGTPVDGVQAYLLDEGLQLVPPATVGEICVGGRGVARGYLGQPRLTAARFTPDPFAGVGPAAAGARIYRTGDRARWTSIGRHTGAVGLQFLGREDTQIKIGGVRVELGAVEGLLQAEALVEQVCVSKEKGSSGQPFLAAYVQPPAEALAESSFEELAAALRERARRILPTAWRPSRWIVAKTLPLTPNGKVDRRALAQLAPVVAKERHRAPESHLQRSVARHWHDVLGGGEPGLDDDFFNAGGHSLTATRLAARLTRDLGFEVPVRLVFEYPQLDALCGELAALSAQAGGEEALAWGRASDPADRSPLSSGQRRLWFLEQLEADAGSAYQMAARLRLRPAVDPQALAAAVETLAARHDLLRARVRVEEAQPWFEIAPRVAAEAVFVAHAEPHAESHSADAASQRILLSDALLWRVDLWPAGEDACEVAGACEIQLTVHHVIADGPSMSLILGELVLILGGRARELGPMEHRYADYVAWLEQRWPEAEQERALERWRQRLAGAAGLLDLPLDHRRPRQQSFAGDAVSLELPAAIGAGMQRLAAAEKTTPFVAWLALVSVVLGRQAATEDVVVGVPVSNRSRSETERLVGFFLNTLPLRVQPRAGLSFAGLLGEVRTHTLAAFEDAELPFERIVDALRPSRDLSHSPIFQVLLTYDEAAPESLSLPGLEVEPLTVPTKTSQLDLSLHVRPRGDQVELSLEYCTALFERATIVRLGQALQAVAGAVLEHPEVPLRDLSFVPARQRAELIASWNPRTPAESETAVVLEAMVQEAMVLQTMVLQTIDRVAHERPDAVALEARSTTPEGGMRAAEKLTYRALRDRSAAIAGALAALELPGESLIAVALGRELDFVATCLAIWRVGGAVLPLDPSHPPARLEMILEDSGAALLIHAGDRVPLPVAPSLSVTSSLPMLDLSDVATDSGGVFEPASSPEALAYVLYTSGSTGRPKGVQISHGALASFLDAIAHDLPLAPGDELLAVTTFMFDIAFLELLLPLIQGAKTVILEQEATADPRRLAAAVECGGTRLLQATPSHWRMLVDSGWPGSDRLLIGCGGERLDTDLSAALVARCEQLWNLYGPTEATIWASTRRIPAAGPGASESIGSPLANSRFYLLDHRLEPMPQGTAAELFIAGDALARGYRGRSALTAERFLPDACGETAGARMYRTGDLVAFAANDGIRFLRRSDDQVKIQGHRIELAEVEQAARQLAAVNDGVAVVQDADSASGARLALHVVLADAEKDAGTEVAEIRARLQRQLPSYMVPTLIAGLAEVPLTPNGKVDRKRLPRLEPSEATAPASTLQEPLALELAALWEDVLGLESTDLDAGFFELGGTSLSAARLIYLIEKHLDVRLPVATLYEHPTPRGLLAVLRQEGVRHAGSTVQLRQGEGAPLFAFPGAGGNSVYFHALARSLPAGTAMVGLQAVGLDGDEAPQRTVAEMATHALTQIRQRQPQGPYWLLGHSLGGRVAFEVARRLEEAGERVAHLAVLDTPAPLPGTETAAPSRRDLEDPMAWLDELEEIVRVTTGHELELDAERLHQLSDDERVAAVAERLIAAGLLPDGRLARGFIHVYQANVRTAYEATQPIDAPITLLRVAREEAADATETATATETETWGWEQLTRRGASSAQVPGEHISMLMPPHVGELAGQLANILTDTEEDVTGPRKSTPASGGVFSHG